MPFGHNCEFKDFATCVQKTGSDRICGALLRDTEDKCRRKRAVLEKLMKYERIVQAMCDTSWAIMPSKLQAIVEFIQLKVEGLSLSPDDIAGLTQQPVLLKAEIFETDNPSNEDSKSAGDKIAVLPIHGTISHRMNMMNAISGGVSTESLGKEFASLVDNPEIGTVVLDIDSPGGSVSGIEELGNQIFKARDKVRIIASANSLAASAAYWLGSQAHEFSVTPSGEVGSIGVIAVHESNFKAQEKEGRDITIIKAGKFKADNSPLEPLTEEAQAAIQERVDERYDTFISAIARGRNISLESVTTLYGEGRVVGAKSALEKGMVDAVETLDETVARLKRMPESSAEAISPAINQEVQVVGFDKSTLEKDAREYVEELESRISGLENQNADSQSEKITDEVMASLPDEVKNQLQAAQDRAEEAIAKAEAAESMAAVERQSRIERELQDKVSKQFPHLPGTVEEKAKMLGAVESLDHDAQKAITTQLAAGNKAIETLLTSEIGESTRVVSNSTFDRIEKMADELVSNEGITKASAIRKIALSHSDLYAQYVDETRESHKQ
jgi:signal peptide peptidase SppA